MPKKNTRVKRIKKSAQKNKLLIFSIIFAAVGVATLALSFAAPGGKKNSSAATWIIDSQQKDSVIEHQTQGGATQADQSLWVTGRGAGNTVDGKRCPWDPDETMDVRLSGTFLAGATYVFQQCFVNDWDGQGVYVANLPEGFTGYVKFFDINNPSVNYRYELNSSRRLCAYTRYNFSIQPNPGKAPYSEPLPYNFYRIDNEGLDGIGRHWKVEISITASSRTSTNITVTLAGYRFRYSGWYPTRCGYSESSSSWTTDVKSTTYENGILVEDRGYEFKHIYPPNIVY